MQPYGSHFLDYDNKLSTPSLLHDKGLVAGYSTWQPEPIIYHQTYNLYKRGISKSTNVITSLCYQLDINDSGSSVNNTISILSSLWCVPQSYVCTINKNTYPIFTDIDWLFSYHWQCDMWYIIHDTY